MNLDPFRHIEAARFSQSHARRRLAKAKEPWERELWSDYINEIEVRIKKMEGAEIEYWESFRRPHA